MKEWHKLHKTYKEAYDNMLQQSRKKDMLRQGGWNCTGGSSTVDELSSVHHKYSKGAAKRFLVLQLVLQSP